MVTFQEYFRKNYWGRFDQLKDSQYLRSLVALYNAKENLAANYNADEMPKLALRIQNDELPILSAIETRLRILKNLTQLHGANIRPQFRSLIAEFEEEAINALEGKSVFSKSIKSILERQVKALKNFDYRGFKKWFGKEKDFLKKNETFGHRVCQTLDQMGVTTDVPQVILARSFLRTRHSVSLAIVMASLVLIVFMVGGMPSTARATASDSVATTYQHDVHSIDSILSAAHMHDISNFLGKHEKDVQILDELMKGSDYSQLSESKLMQIKYYCIQIRIILEKTVTITNASDQELYADILKTYMMTQSFLHHENDFTNIDYFLEKIQKYSKRFKHTYDKYDWKKGQEGENWRFQALTNLMSVVFLSPHSFDEAYQFLEDNDLDVVSFHPSDFLPSFLAQNIDLVKVFHKHYPFPDKVMYWKVDYIVEIAYQAPPDQRAQFLEEQIALFKANFGVIKKRAITSHDADWMRLMVLFCKTGYMESFNYGVNSIYDGTKGNYDFLRLSTTTDSVLYLIELNTYVHAPYTKSVQIDTASVKQTFDKLHQLGYRTRYPADVANIILNNNLIVENDLYSVVAKYGITYFKAYSLEMLIELRDRDTSTVTHKKSALVIQSKSDYNEAMGDKPDYTALRSTHDVVVIEVGGRSDLIEAIGRLGDFDIIIPSAHGSEDVLQVGDIPRWTTYFLYDEDNTDKDKLKKNSKDAYVRMHDKEMIAILASHMKTGGTLLFSSCKSGKYSGGSPSNMVSGFHDGFKSIGRPDILTVGPKGSISGMELAIDENGNYDPRYFDNGASILTLQLGGVGLPKPGMDVASVPTSGSTIPGSPR